MSRRSYVESELARPSMSSAGVSYRARRLGQRPRKLPSDAQLSVRIVVAVEWRSGVIECRVGLLSGGVVFARRCVFLVDIVDIRRESGEWFPR